MDVESTFSTLTDGLKLWSDRYPEREAFIFIDRNGRQSTCNPDELYLMAGRFACRLRKQGFQPGDIICNAISNSLERLVTDFGIILAGCIGVNCQVVETDGADLWNMARITECVAAIVPIRQDNPSYRLFQQFLPSAIPKSGFVNVSISKAPYLKTVIIVDRYCPSEAQARDVPSLITDLKENNEDIFVHKPEPSNLAYIFQTSGSTGYCKLIPRTHDEILLQARALSTQADKASNKYFSDRPFGWSGGYPFHYIRNCSVLVTQDYFDGKQIENAKALWSEISREGCPKAFFLPKQIMAFLKEFETEPPQFKMELIISGGQPITKVVTEAIGVLTKYMVITYASTEASAITNQFIADKSQFQDYMCGQGFADTRLKIVDQFMKEVEPGKDGRILLKTKRMLRRYYNQDTATPIFTPDGWLITGDRGWLNDEGVLFVIDRDDNVINHGAILVYPSWLESVLARSPYVQEVAVIGIPEATGGSELCACVVLKEQWPVSKEDLMKFYEESFVKWHRQEYVPRLNYIELIDEIPKTFNQKIDRHRLRELIFSRLGVAIDKL